MESVVDIIRQQTEELKIPQEFIEQFVEHYENRDKWYSIDEIINIYYNYDNDTNKYDSRRKNIVQELKTLDDCYKREVASKNFRSKQGGSNKIDFEVSYEGLMEFLMSKPKFKELRKYYVRCESIMFALRNRVIEQSQ